MKKITSLIFLVLLFFSCKQADVVRETNEQIATMQASLARIGITDIVISPNLIKHFEWNTSYNVRIKNNSKTKTYDGYLVATAKEQDGTIIHKSKVKHLILQPKSTLHEIVYIRKYVVGPIPPPYIPMPGKPKKSKMICEVTFEEGAY